MNPERWQQISRIFKSAISLDGAARAAYVEEKCGPDSDLRQEVSGVNLDRAGLLVWDTVAIFPISGTEVLEPE